MPRPRKSFPSNGAVKVILTPDEFALLDALADQSKRTRTAQIKHMIAYFAAGLPAFDVAEQNRMAIRSPHAPNNNVHLRHVYHNGDPLFLWCFDPDPVTGKIHAAESASCVDQTLDVASFKIPRTTIAKALQWAARARYRPPGKW